MRKDILNLFSLELRQVLESINDRDLSEIRLRTGQPMILMRGNREYFVSNGMLKNIRDKDTFIVKEADIKESLEFITNYSIYAFNEEIKRGFITVTGGHRVGVCGKAVYENGEIKTIRNIQSLNVRISHEIKGCGRKIVPYLFEKNIYKNTLIIASPGMGKTTLLRDLIRLLSDGLDGITGRTIGVVDERSEIAACYLGKPQNDLGIRTDVLDCCQKKDGMVMLVRSMRPDIVAVDELGSVEDSKSLEYCGLCGCRILATIHGSSIAEICEKPGMSNIMEQGFFRRFILCELTLDNRFKKYVYNEKYELIGEVYD